MASFRRQAYPRYQVNEKKKNRIELRLYVNGSNILLLFSVHLLLLKCLTGCEISVSSDWGKGPIKVVWGPLLELRKGPSLMKKKVGNIYIYIYIRAPGFSPISPP